MADDSFPLRESLARVFRGDHRTIAAFEQLFDKVQASGATLASNAEATSQLQDATVISLSPNAALNNERILQIEPGIEAVDDGVFLTLRLKDVARTDGGFDVTLIAAGDAQLVVPLAGTVLVNEHIGAGLGNYANDAAAAAGGVPVQGLYHNAGALRVRLV